MKKKNRTSVPISHSDYPQRTLRLILFSMMSVITRIFLDHWKVVVQGRRADCKKSLRS